MADSYFYNYATETGQGKVKLLDNGDGTFSMAIGPGTSSGEKELAKLARLAVPMETRLVREGYVGGIRIQSTSTYLSAGFTTFQLSPAPFGNAWYASTITITGSRAFAGRLQVSTPAVTSSSVDLEINYISGTLIIPLDAMIPPGSGVNLLLYGGNDASITITMGQSGYRIGGDMRWGAERVLLWVGDGTMVNGPTIGTALSNAAHFRVRDDLLDRGVDVRICTKWTSSAFNTSNLETQRSVGVFDVPQADMIVYAMGVQDATVALAQATYLANWLAFYQWKKRTYPLARLVFVGTTPTDNNANEAYLAIYRSDMSAFVAGLGDPLVKFLDLGSSFDRTNSANFFASDTANARVNPSVAGNALMYSNGWQPFIAANVAWLKG